MPANNTSRTKKSELSLSVGESNQNHMEKVIYFSQFKKKVIIKRPRDI